MILGQKKFISKYLSGKLCPLTPSQQPTNIRHLAVQTLPAASTLNLLQGSETGAEADKSKVKQDKSNLSNPCIIPHLSVNPDGCANNANDSNGYCLIM